MTTKLTQTIAFAAIAVLMASIVAMIPTASIANAQVATLDTGVEVQDPDGYDITLGNSDYTPEQVSTLSETPSTAGIHFKGHSTSSLVLIGYFSLSACTNGNDEVSVQLNGGPHNSQNAQYTDTIDLEIMEFDADVGKLRTLEEFGGSYSSAITPGPINANSNPATELDTETLCAPGPQNFGDTENGRQYVGYQVQKLNVDENEDGTPDKVAIQAWVDKGGRDETFDEECGGCFLFSPANDWVQVFEGLYTPAQLTNLDSVFVPEIRAVDPSLQYQSFRIDNQAGGGQVEIGFESEWLSLTNVTSVVEE